MNRNIQELKISNARLNYIESTGTQYINTEVIHKANTKIECVLSVTENTTLSYESPFGSRLTSYHDNAMGFFTRFNGANVPCYFRTGVETTGNGLPYNMKIRVTCYLQTCEWYDMDNILLGRVVTTGNPNDDF